VEGISRTNANLQFPALLSESMKSICFTISKLRYDINSFSLRAGLSERLEAIVIL